MGMPLRVRTIRVIRETLVRAIDLRNAAIVREALAQASRTVSERKSLTQIGADYGLTKQMVSLIVSAERRRTGECPLRDLQAQAPPKDPPAQPKMLRFWARVDRSGGPDSCWPWVGGRDMVGYGNAKMMLYGQRYRYAHRISWVITKEAPIPAGLSVLHRCDNPPCVNPSHLWLGTQRDNVADRDRKGRGRCASQSDHAKLTPDVLTTIQALLAAPRAGERRRPHARLSREFGLSRSTIRAIDRSASWVRAYQARTRAD
jgi:hypothetical protein